MNTPEHPASGGTAEHQPSPRGHTSGTSWDSLIRNGALLLVLLVMVWLVFNVDLPTAAQMEDRIDDFGWLAWLVFIGVYAVVALTPIPVTVMAVTGGLLFGVGLGSGLSVIGVLLGSWGGYWIARALGTDLVRKLLGSHGQRVESYLDGAGFEAVATLRLMPGIPYWPVNYGSGAFGIDQRTFLSASVVSVVPGQISLVALGAVVANPTWYNMTAVGVGWAAVITMTVVASRRWKRATRENRSHG
ncbi:TVP38/TMEM64 family protein [Kocuria sp.]|uniref:TVP38/TMEM64 family protein n=1 Tax=Kocuria sp. TaxID=1871328 RepID=UPI0026DF3931|nr:VTT domain-containing protein [Kocuria sp.]MDO5618244.1 VTT domain-containing protein [Kocuria sp.]